MTSHLQAVRQPLDGLASCPAGPDQRPADSSSSRAVHESETKTTKTKKTQTMAPGLHGYPAAVIASNRLSQPTLGPLSTSDTLSRAPTSQTLAEAPRPRNLATPYLRGGNVCQGCWEGADSARAMEDFATQISEGRWLLIDDRPWLSAPKHKLAQVLSK